MTLLRGGGGTDEPILPLMMISLTSPTMASMPLLPFTTPSMVHFVLMGRNVFCRTSRSSLWPILWTSSRDVQWSSPGFTSSIQQKDPAAVQESEPLLSSSFVPIPIPAPTLSMDHPPLPLFHRRIHAPQSISKETRCRACLSEVSTPWQKRSRAR